MSVLRAVSTQARTEVVLAVRQGEQLLVALGIPLLVLVFFSVVDVLPLGGGRPVDVLTPSVAALAVLSSSMVGVGISTGFERHYGVLKRLGVSPLSRPRLLAAKALATLSTEAVQLVVLLSVALVLGWDPSFAPLPFVGAVLLGTVAFGGLGMLLAGVLSGPANLAVNNAVYLLLLLFGGVAVPASELPGPIGAIAALLPSGALVAAMGDALGATEPAGVGAWVVLGAWAVVTPVAAAATFSWVPRD